METTQSRSVVRTIMPWIVAVAMLLVYLVTLNTTPTAQSVWPLARASGMDWHSVFVAPLTYLVTFPIRWLPAGAQLFTLNFLAALFAAWSLGLLARSVSILPHDRTQLQRDKRIDENGFMDIKLAWVPVVFAVVVAGLQLTFWENAVVGTGEMLDLLLFAYCVRCLLEYRIEEKNSWLFRLAVVYGAGIANNVAMIAFFPALLVSLVWIKGWRFFRFDFLVKMFLLGLAGLSLYLLLPLVNMGETPFWASLKTNLVYQKQIVFGLRRAALMPAIYCMVPLILMGIKWPGSFGDSSPMGKLFANGAAVLLHAGLLAFCVYVAFDPPTPVSPRHIAEQYREFGVRFVFLPAYYLGALIVGYYSGFLLLLFSKPEGRSRRREALPPALNFAVSAVLVAGAAFVAGKLVFENLPKIRALNSTTLRDYAAALVKSLPEKPSVIFSDDPVQLHAARAVGAGKAGHIFIEATALTEPAYHRFLQKRYGAQLPKVQPFPGEAFISSPQNIEAVKGMGATRELVYLHPSFGYFFEAFYLEPRGATYRMKLYPANTVTAPAPSAELIAAQQSYWSSMREDALKEVKAALPGISEEPMQRMEFTPAYVGSCYSRALDWWAVELQRANRFAEAAPWFTEALALNPNNAAALVNSRANALWRNERKRLAELTTEEQKKLAIYRGNVTYLFTVCGPVDEPSFLTELALTFTQNSLYRQAEQMYLRGLDYAPDDIALQLSLVNVRVLAQKAEAAIGALNEMRKQANWATTEMATRIEAARLEAMALMAKGDFAEAERLMKSLVKKNPETDATHYALSQLYTSYAEKLSDAGNVAASSAQRINALNAVEDLLKLQPTNAVAWFTCGNLAYFTGNHERAAQAFSQVLDLTGQNNKAALINRAMSNLRIGMTVTNETARAAKLQLAKKDYHTYQLQFAPDYRVYFGLGEIAFAEKNWKVAREHYEEYLKAATSAKMEERQYVRDRLDELKKM